MYLVINLHNFVPLYDDNGEAMHFDSLMHAKLECIRWHLHNGRSYKIIIHNNILDIEFKIRTK